MRINYFFSKPDIYINADKINESHAILVTGLSGSGKSYLTSQIVNQKKIHRCSFDNLLENDIMYEATNAEKKILEEFLKNNPQYLEIVIRKQKVKEFFNEFLDFCLKYLEEKNMKMVLDCAAFINTDVIPFEKIKKLPIIVKQTSYFKGVIRRLKRNYKYLKSKKMSFLRLYYHFFKDCLYIIKRTPTWIKRKKKFLIEMKKNNIISKGKGEFFYEK